MVRDALIPLQLRNLLHIASQILSINSPKLVIFNEEHENPECHDGLGPCMVEESGHDEVHALDVADVGDVVVRFLEVGDEEGSVDRGFIGKSALNVVVDQRVGLWRYIDTDLSDVFWNFGHFEDSEVCSIPGLHPATWFHCFGFL